MVINERTRNSVRSAATSLASLLEKSDPDPIIVFAQIKLMLQRLQRGMTDHLDDQAAMIEYATFDSWWENLPL